MLSKLHRSWPFYQVATEIQTKERTLAVYSPMTCPNIDLLYCIIILPKKCFQVSRVSLNEVYFIGDYTETLQRILAAGILIVCPGTYHISVLYMVHKKNWKIIYEKQEVNQRARVWISETYWQRTTKVYQITFTYFFNLTSIWGTFAWAFLNLDTLNRLILLRSFSKKLHKHLD